MISIDKNMDYNKLETEVENFLRTVDSVLNSNTFLLVISLIGQPKDLKGFLSEFISSKQFKELMIEQDKIHSLGCYSYYDFIEGEVVEVINYSGEFYKPNFELSMEKISYDGLEKILLNMITTNKSIYKKQLSSDIASPIVNMFLDKIFKGKNIKNLTDEWNIYSVKPNFLNTTYMIDKNSGEEEQNKRLCYFDDCGFDSCTVFYNKERLYMLLTNGMP